MKVAALICVPLGHRWHPVESDTPYSLLECGRCGRLRELTTESRGPEGWMERRTRGATMSQMMDDPGRRR
jgi:hypothetical protein